MFASYNQDSDGRGVCIIFTLFTNDMTGYKSDVSRAFAFFKHELGYTVYADETHMKNCTQRQLLASIDFIARQIEKENKKGKPFDRLAFVLMSHGLKVN